MQHVLPHWDGTRLPVSAAWRHAPRLPLGSAIRAAGGAQCLEAEHARNTVTPGPRRTSLDHHTADVATVAETPRRWLPHA